MELDRTGEDTAFDITAEITEIFGGAFVGDALHGLFDDGTFVQINGGVVGGGTDHFHAALPRLKIGVAPLKGGKESVVDVDDPAGIGVDDPFRKDTHVAGQHHKVDVVAFEKLKKSVFLIGIAAPGGGKAVVGDPETVGDLFEIGVIPHSHNDFPAQIPLFGTHEKIVKTVRSL